MQALQVLRVVCTIVADSLNLQLRALLPDAKRCAKAICETGSVCLAMTATWVDV